MKVFLASALLVATLIAGVASPASAGNDECGKPVWVSDATDGNRV